MTEPHDVDAMSTQDQQEIKYALAEALGLPTGNAWDRFRELDGERQEALVRAIAAGERRERLIDRWHSNPPRRAVESVSEKPADGDVSPETMAIDSVAANAANDLNQLPIHKKWVALLNDRFGSAAALREFLAGGGDLANQINGIGPRTTEKIKQVFFGAPLDEPLDPVDSESPSDE